VVGAAAHLDLAFLPVNLRVMFTKPREAQYDILFPEAGHCEHGLFQMVVISQYNVDNLCDATRFIQRPINIVDWDSSA
jgi:hypothetical protein